MVDWTNPLTEYQELLAFNKVVLSCFGLYVWELFVTVDFEWSIFTGRRSCQWHLVSHAITLRTKCDPVLTIYALAVPLRVCHSHVSDLSIFIDNGNAVFFFICRYCMLVSLIGLIISMSVKQQIDCAALYTFNAVVDSLSIITATTVLMIRTIVMWERDLIISTVLCTIGLAHWIVLWRAMFIINVAWESSVSTRIGPPPLLTIPLSDGLRLADSRTRCRKSSASYWRLRRLGLLFDEGLVFFLVAGLSNVVPAACSNVFGILNLNPVMNLITTIPASVVTAIAACRTVVQLPEVQADLFINVSSIVGDNTTVRHIHAQRRTIQHGAASKVRINTEMIVMEDCETRSKCSMNPSDILQGKVHDTL
ncbi:hypothetical protein EVG20_g511 [Dentipellis fragilis]|uniref:Uncharacterized protein n=1 Tax=Dentipellis fragilis TaxID=205917 RepID=A0A4Y9ZES0_9AGAM|nr:hypothetical protein EVG20_g511 [Dentipellis fragilis]